MSAPATDRSDAARRYHRIQFRLSALGLGLAAAYLLALVLTGASVALARAVETLASAWWLQLPLALVALGGAYRLLTWPLAVLSGFWLPRRFGLLHQPFSRWLWDGVKAAALGGAIGLVMAEVVYALLRATPWWWLWSALALLAVSALVTLVAPVWLVPIFYRLTPLPDGELRDRLVALAQRLGVPVLDVSVTDQSRKSRTANAAVTGLGRTRRIILFDTLANNFTADEVEAVLAHELGHHVHADIWRGLVLQTVVTLAIFWVADHALRGAAAALGLDGPAAIAALPLFGLIVMGASLVTLPLVNGWSRRVEGQADAFALETTRDPRAFIAAMERLAALNLAEREPHPIKEFFLYSHPSIGRRVARALAWERSGG
jgi:Zn-dependent protease with chaperone function